MEMRKIVICSKVAISGLLSAATGFAAEATRIKRNQVVFDPLDPTQCSYSTSPAYYLGITSDLTLILAKITVSFASRCMCCRRGPESTTANRSIALVCFIFSWFTFIIALVLLLAGASLNEQQSEGDKTYLGNACYIVKPGVFAGGAFLSLLTVALGITYYLTLNSTKQSNAAAVTGGGLQHQAAGIPTGQPLTQTTDHGYTTYTGQHFTQEPPRYS